jgi:hypothetical protein
MNFRRVSEIESESQVVSSCVWPCVLYMGIMLVTVYYSCFKIRDLLLILFECACLLDSSEE